MSTTAHRTSGVLVSFISDPSSECLSNTGVDRYVPIVYYWVIISRLVQY